MASFKAPLIEVPVEQLQEVHPQELHSHEEHPQAVDTQEVHTEELHHRTLYNRIEAVISHISWYSFKTQSRLAADSEVSKAAISRLIHGKCQPSLTVALQVARAIEKRLGRPLNIWELFSLDGDYPTASVCTLMGCRNCLPRAFYDSQETLKSEFKHIGAGQWSLSQPYLKPQELRSHEDLRAPEDFRSPAIVQIRQGAVGRPLPAIGQGAS